MRAGDISNKVKPTIMVRMNETMFRKVVRKTKLNKLKAKLGMKPSTRYDLSYNAYGFLYHLAYETDYNVRLVYMETDVDLKEKKEVLDKFKLLGVDILYLREYELNALLDYTPCYIVDTTSYRNGVYTLYEAIRQFK